MEGNGAVSLDPIFVAEIYLSGHTVVNVKEWLVCFSFSRSVKAFIPNVVVK